MKKMAHRFFVFFLISFSLGVFSGGYVYANQTAVSNPEETKKCNTPQYQKEQYGASTFIDLDYQNVEDYLMGQKLNYDLFCPRIFLNMKKTIAGDNSAYEGSFVVAYEDTVYNEKEKTVHYDSGDTVKESQFNTWEGDWKAPDVNFAAIFETDNSAVILRINEVKKIGAVDGKPTYKGYGEVWF